MKISVTKPIYILPVTVNKLLKKLHILDKLNWLSTTNLFFLIAGLSHA